jgi:hypothetical protein
MSLMKDFCHAYDVSDVRDVRDIPDFPVGCDVCDFLYFLDVQYGLGNCDLLSLLSIMA